MQSALTLRALMLGSALVAVASGCASVEDSKDIAEARAPREYRTGSNLPVRDPTPSATEQERQRAADEIRALQRTGSAGKPKS